METEKKVRLVCGTLMGHDTDQDIICWCSGGFACCGINCAAFQVAKCGDKYYAQCRALHGIQDMGEIVE